MKKIFYPLLFSGLFASTAVNAQTFRLGVRNGSSSNRFIITGRPNFNFSAKLVETGFAIMFPKQSPPGTPIAAPVFSVTTSCASCTNATFPPANWQQVNDFVSDPDFYLYKFGCVNPNIGTSPLLNIGSSTDQDIVEVNYTGPVIPPSQIRLAHLGDGGPGFQYGVSVYDDTPPPGNSDRVNYIQIFVGAGVSPVVPYPDEGTGYSNTQYVPFGFTVVSVNWLSFNAVKSGKDVLLNWRVSDESSNLRYELQRSVNGVDFFHIAAIDKTGTGNAVKDYSYIDQSSAVLNAPIIYYRLKQVNIDGRFTFSEIRNIRLKGAGDITVYPNPVKGGFYINAPLTGVDKSTVQLKLVTLSGQTVISKEITALQASNYYFDMKGLSPAAGQYHLQIIHEGKLLATKNLLINK